MDPTYYLSVNASAAGANKRHLTIWNGSTQMVRVYAIHAAGAPTAAVAGLVIPLYAARISTAPTGGSAATSVKAATANPNLPGALTVTTGDTGGATEVGPVGAAVASGEETASANGEDLLRDIKGTQPLSLAQNEGVVVRQGALASAGNVTIVAVVGVTPA